VAYQIDRNDAHLVALPRRHADGRQSSTQQIAISIATRLRTADAAKIDNTTIADIENGLMQLSEAVASSYLNHNERSEAAWELLA
jgi:hypothetical protein